MKDGIIFNSVRKAAEDRRVEEEKRRLAKETEERRLREIREEEERQIRIAEENRKREEQRKKELEKSKKRRKRTLITLGSIFGCIVLLIVGITVGSKIKANIDYKNSSTGKFLAFLEDYQGYEDGILTEYVDIESRGRVLFNLEYNKNGWHDDWNKTYDFRVAVVLPPKTDSSYTEILGTICFNLDGSDNADSFKDAATPYNRNPNYSAKVTYSGGYVCITYDYVAFNSTTNELTYRSAFYSDTTHDIDGGTHKTEWQEEAWAVCSSGFTWVNELFNQATGNDLYK